MIPARHHTFDEIDHEIVSTVILLLLIQEGMLSVTRESMCTEYWLTALSKLAQEKKSTDFLEITIAVDWDVNPQTKENNKDTVHINYHNFMRYFKNCVDRDQLASDQDPHFS